MRQEKAPVGKHGQPVTHTQLAVVSTATVLSVLIVIFIVQDLIRQPVLITSLASSTFLLYYQPLNEINRFGPLVFGHIIATSIGYLASLLLPVPYVSAAVSMALSIVVLVLLRMVHPPAISTSLVFSYRPHDATVIVTFLLTLAVVIALAFTYLLLRKGIQPSRWAHHFGLHEQDGRPGQ